MVKRVIEERVDDLDGGPAERTTTFSLDNMYWEIELSEANRANLEDALSDYMAAGRRLKGQRAAGSDVASVTPVARGLERSERERRQAIRQWARANGIDIGDRGRIALAIELAYNEAQSAT